MPVRTAHGWASRGQIKRQIAAWRKARKMLRENLGDAWGDEAQLNERAEEIFRRLLRDSKTAHSAASSAGIDAPGLQKALSAAGVEVSDHDAARMIKESDENSDGLLQLVEFQAVIRNEVASFRRTSTVCSIL